MRTAAAIWPRSALVLKIVAALAIAASASSCAASNYAHQNFDSVANVVFIDPDTRQEYYIRDKPAENRMKMTIGAGSAMGMLVVGRNGVPPAPLYEAAAIKFLRNQGRECTVTRSFEIVMAELEIQYACRLS